MQDKIWQQKQKLWVCVILYFIEHTVGCAETANFSGRKMTREGNEGENRKKKRKEKKEKKEGEEENKNAALHSKKINE